MRPYSRANRTAFRRAVGASVALHVVAACALVLFVRSGAEQKTVESKIDTHAANEPQVRMHLVEEAVSVEVTPTPPATTAPAAQSTNASAPQEALPAKPQAAARATPQTLLPEMVALIRRPAPAQVSAPAVPMNAGVTDPNVKPVGGPNANVSANGAALAMHGALVAGKTVVYVLDCSGSMGAAGKFDAARAALVATLRQQPATVRFQVIVYAGSAVPLLASGRDSLPATDANIRDAAAKLAALEARGKSSHLEAVRAALAYRPDVIVILTDADDLTAAKLKPVLVGESTPVRLGQVTAEGVQRPRELK